MLSSPMDVQPVKARFFRRLSGKRVACDLCGRRCVIKDGECGFCGARENRNGELYSLIYGRVSSMAWANVERKPLFHFYPGEVMLSVGSLGCNFRCPGCQNWHIAHADVLRDLPSADFVSPEELVRLAVERKCLGISWTYNEPTIWFEYTLDCAKLAKKAGLMTNYVTNGAISIEALDEIGPYLDAFRVDIKGFSAETYKRVANFPRFGLVLEATERAKKKWNMHVECVTNITPGYNDDLEELSKLAEWIRDALGSGTPWHVTRFVPHLDLSHVPPTPVSTLEEARRIGMEKGLRFVYIGNVPGHPAESTYCPSCGKLLIKRDSVFVAMDGLRGGRCTACGEVIEGRFR